MEIHPINSGQSIVWSLNVVAALLWIETVAGVEAVFVHRFVSPVFHLSNVCQNFSVFGNTWLVDGGPGATLALAEVVTASESGALRKSSSLGGVGYQERFMNLACASPCATCDTGLLLKQLGAVVLFTDYVADF